MVPVLSIKLHIQMGTLLYMYIIWQWVKIKTQDDVIKWKHFPRYWPFCAGNSPVTGEFPSQRPVTRCFDIFFDLRPNKHLSEQSWGWWFETPSCPLWRQCNDMDVTDWVSIRRQAIIWTNVELFPIGPSRTNFSEIQIKIQNFSFMKMHLKMSSAKWRPFCTGVLNQS